MDVIDEFGEGLDYVKPRKEKNYYKLRVDMEEGRKLILYLRSENEIFIDKLIDNKPEEDIFDRLKDNKPKMNIEKITKEEYSKICKQ